MKQLKSSLSDLRRLFTRTITLRDIAEPLVSFDHGQPVKDVAVIMEKREFDVVGIRQHGMVTGYVIRTELTHSLIGASRRAFKAGEVFSDSEPLLGAFSALRNQRHVFINVLGHVGGIVTRGDLQKAPVRLWLFGLVSLLEMQMLRLVRERYPHDSWGSLMAEKRMAAAHDVFNKRRLRSEQTELSDCLQIVDKANIILKDDILFSATGFNSKRSSEDFFHRLGGLRDDLAHGADILNGQCGEWAELSALVGTLESLLEKFETVVVEARP